MRDIRESMGNFNLGGSLRIVVAILIIIGVGIACFFTSQFAYFFERVQEEEVGIQFQGGRIQEIVGPGVYNDFGLYVELRRISTRAVPFTVTDEEIITKDKQRIGLAVSGDFVRPDESRSDELRILWARYRDIYLSDDLATRPG